MYIIKNFFSQAILLLLVLNLNTVLAQFDISVPSLEVTIGQPFTVSWTLVSNCNEPDDVDICLNTNTEPDLQFIQIGSVTRNGSLSGSLDITLNSTIVPMTYTLGIRFPGCSFLLAEEFDDFVVNAASTSTSCPALTSRQLASRITRGNVV